MPFPTPIIGIDHIALTVADAARAKAFYGGFLGLEDVFAAMRYCEAAGLELKRDNHKIPGVTRFFIRDPDGNRIEFQGRGA